MRFGSPTVYISRWHELRDESLRYGTLLRCAAMLVVVVVAIRGTSFYGELCGCCDGITRETLSGETGTIYSAHPSPPAHADNTESMMTYENGVKISSHIGCQHPVFVPPLAQFLGLRVCDRSAPPPPRQRTVFQASVFHRGRKGRNGLRFESLRISMFDVGSTHTM